MANEIKEKFGTVSAITITLAGLASSTAGVGRASAAIDNTTDRFGKVFIFLQIDLGASTVDRSVQVYGLRADNHASQIATDGWAETNAGLTVLNAQLLGVLITKTANEVLRGEFVFENPGPSWGIAIVHDTAVALDATEGNHLKHYIGVNPEVQ